MKMTSATIAALALGLSAALLAQGPRRDGRFEIKMEMDMPGMPMKIPPITTVQCITPEQANDPQKAMPPQGGRSNENNCKLSDYKQDGNKVTWSMKCEGKDAMTGSGEFLYTSDGYTGTMKMERGGQPMTMKYNAKRLGDCTK
jgi:hypothetical protein